MIALHSVVLPMPLRPMSATGSSAHLEAHVLQHVRAAVVDVEVLDRQQRRAVGQRRGRSASAACAIASLTVDLDAVVGHAPAEVELVDELVGADLVGRALHDLAAVVHHRDALGDAQGDVHVVLDEDQRDALVELEQQVGERDALAAREARGRLVEQHELRARWRGPSRPRAGAARRARSSRRGRRSWPRGRRRRASSRARSRISPSTAVRRQAQVPAARAEHGEVEVVLDAQAEEEPGLLVGAPHPQPRAARRRGRRRCPGPGTRSSPTSAGMSPEMTLNSVVFPAPLGPRMARRSPCATSRSTSRTASRPPNRRPTPRRRRIGPAGSVVTSCTSCRYPPTTLTGVALPSHGRSRFSQPRGVAARSRRRAR